MKIFFQSILDFIFPIECVGCGDELRAHNLSQDRNYWLCDYCFSKIEFNKKQICPLCGREIKIGYSCVCAAGIEVGLEGIEWKDGEEYNNISNQKFKIKNLKSWVDVYITFVDLKKNPQVARLIHKLKYEFVEGAAADLAKIGIKFLDKICKFADGYSGGLEISNLLFGGDVIWAPIPLHKKRLLWRGFNQSELILREIEKRIREEYKESRQYSEKLEIENLKFAIRTDILIRKKNTRFQGKSKMAENDRRENMRGAFEARRCGAISNVNPASSAGQILKKFQISLPAPILRQAVKFQFFKKNCVKNDHKAGVRDEHFFKDKTVILFDDVITAGATMEECARVLKEAGAMRVIAMAVGKG
ncbi:MAG: double zinc ribbon domain-containing protein [bacterium]